MQLAFEPIVVPAVSVAFGTVPSFSRRRHIDLERVTTCLCRN